MRHFTLAILLACYAVSSAQSYRSASGYTFEIPSGFKELQTSRQATDFKFIDNKNRLFVLQTFTRTRSEEGITAHDYDAQYLQSVYSQNDPSTLVYSFKKLFVGEFEAYVAGYSNSKNPSVCEMLIYKGDQVFLFVLYTKQNGAEERLKLEGLFKDFYKNLKV